MNLDSEPLVYIVDDDAAVGDSLRMLFRSVGLRTAVFQSAVEFLAAFEPGRHACLLLDIRMPGMSGMELQEELAERGVHIPIVFITGHGDVPMAVRAMQSGAVDFIQKPFRDQELLERVNKALSIGEEQLEAEQQSMAIRRRLDSLTPREREVMDKVVEGWANKVIAIEFGVSQRTVELHRARVMQKMGVRSLAELVRAVELVRSEL